MNRTGKIDPDELRRRIEAGESQAACARHFGVSETAIHLRLKSMRVLTSRVVALEKAGELVDRKLNATDRLEQAQRVIDRQLEWAVTQAEQPGVDRAALSEVIVRLTSEVRQQLALQLSITKALVDLKVVREFQDTVIQAIREEEPATARRIVDRLKERRALRPSARIAGLEETDGFLR